MNLKNQKGGYPLPVVLADSLEIAGVDAGRRSAPPTAGKCSELTKAQIIAADRVRKSIHGRRRAVCKRFEFSRRRENLTFYHHELVAPLRAGGPHCRRASSASGLIARKKTAGLPVNCRPLWVERLRLSGTQQIDF